MAMLVVLETLTPLERAVFVLHEVFGYAHPRSPRSSTVRRPRSGSSPTGRGSTSRPGALATPPTRASDAR